MRKKFGLGEKNEKFIITEIIKNICNSEFDKVIADSIRPIIFYSNGYYGIFGTGFFILHGEDLYFLTARHNVIRKDLFISENFSDLQKNIDSFFIINNLRKGIDLKNTKSIIKEEIHNIFFHSILPKNEKIEGLGSEDLNDIAIVTFNEEFAKKFMLDKKLISLDTNGLRKKEDMGKSVDNNDIVFIAGYCLDKKSKNEVIPVKFDDEGNVIKSEMSLNINYLFGKIVESTTSLIKQVNVFFDNGFTDYNGFSGSPVFLYKDKNIYFTGLVIRGGNKQIYFISIDFIRLYLMRTDIGSVNNKFFINENEALNSCYEMIKLLKDDIKIIDVQNKQIIININKEEFSISCEYLCDVISLEILLNNRMFFNQENHVFIRDFCYNMISNSDKILLKKCLISNLNENILKKLKLVYYEYLKKGYKIDLNSLLNIIKE
ncbi:hypothetical protein C3L23_06375 [Nautilia sp. PV-1]|uniref:hypothetical protein n=1 Tax=Nautilia sp. PV-1 TaxID=2579250 RepID=UPI000FDC7ED4|nr:hypothetical protein [Nautilia sp. PV-1]AZV46908.1 hypothetical protein C3L23_06375 [Nautilia sp. PV-1]